MEELVRVLEREWDLLEHVRYRAEIVLLLLRGGETRFLGTAADELHAALDELGRVELLRAGAVSDLADTWGIPEQQLTLSALIAAAPPDAADGLIELQARLRSAVAGSQEVVRSASTLTAAEVEILHRSMARFGAGPTIPNGYVGSSSATPPRFDGAL